MIPFNNGLCGKWIRVRLNLCSIHVIPYTSYQSLENVDLFQSAETWIALSFSSRMTDRSHCHCELRETVKLAKNL